MARGSEGAKGGVAVRVGDAVDGGGVDRTMGLCGEGCDDEGGTAVAIESVGGGRVVDMKSPLNSEGRSTFGTGTPEIQGGCGEGGRGGSDDGGASGSTDGGSGEGGGEGSRFVVSIWSEKCSMEKEGLRQLSGESSSISSPGSWVPRWVSVMPSFIDSEPIAEAPATGDGDLEDAMEPSDTIPPVAFCLADAP